MACTVFQKTPAQFDYRRAVLPAFQNGLYKQLRVHHILFAQGVVKVIKTRTLIEINGVHSKSAQHIFGEFRLACSFDNEGKGNGQVFGVAFHNVQNTLGNVAR
jgi:hypothetical protein